MHLRDARFVVFHLRGGAYINGLVIQDHLGGVGMVGPIVLLLMVLSRFQPFLVKLGLELHAKLAGTAGGAQARNLSVTIHFIEFNRNCSSIVPRACLIAFTRSQRRRNDDRRITHVAVEV